jgi:hypothetical protein
MIRLRTNLSFLKSGQTVRFRLKMSFSKELKKVFSFFKNFNDDSEDVRVSTQLTSILIMSQSDGA